MKPKKPWRRALGTLLADERGGEVIEWALVAGLVVIATIAVIGAIGTKVLARWNSLNNAPL
jgi:pilus assembly protein Flp/PilA